MSIQCAYVQAGAGGVFECHQQVTALIQSVVVNRVFVCRGVEFCCGRDQSQSAGVSQIAITGSVHESVGDKVDCDRAVFEISGDGIAIGIRRASYKNRGGNPSDALGARARKSKFSVTVQVVRKVSCRAEW